VPTVCIQIELVPSSRYRVFHAGHELGVWKQPETAAARALLEAGHAQRSDTLRTYRGEMLCLTGNVGWLADRTISERDDGRNDGTPRFVRWYPPVFGNSVPPVSGLKLPSDDLPVSLPTSEMEPVL
jgi:hypothetical protein